MTVARDDSRPTTGDNVGETPPARAYLSSVPWKAPRAAIPPRLHTCGQSRVKAGQTRSQGHGRVAHGGDIPWTQRVSRNPLAPSPRTLPFPFDVIPAQETALRRRPAFGDMPSPIQCHPGAGRDPGDADVYAQHITCHPGAGRDPALEVEHPPYFPPLDPGPRRGGVQPEIHSQSRWTGSTVVPRHCRRRLCRDPGPGGRGPPRGVEAQHDRRDGFSLRGAVRSGGIPPMGGCTSSL